MKRGIDADRIDPEFLMALSDPLEAVYEAIEHDLLVNLARRFRGGMRLLKSLVPGSDAWRAYMLAQIGGLTDENMRLIAQYSGDVSELTQLAVRMSVESAIDAVEPALAAAVRQPDYVPARSETAQRVMEAYSAQALNQLNLVNTVMLNSSLRAYEKAVNDTTAYQRRLDAAQQTLNAQTGMVIMGTVSRQQAVSSAVQRMASEGLTGFTDAAGRRWSAQAYVQMDIRTTTANAARQAMFDRNEAHGNRLISVSSHPGARPLCAPYQGKIFSTDGTSGTTEDLHGNRITYSPLSATSYGQPAGLFGINCGHLPSPFIPGLSVVRAAQYDPEENARLYEESQKQRYMERKVRRAKTQADVLEAAGDVEGAKALRKKARQMNAELRTWCEANGRDYDSGRVRVVKTGEALKMPDKSVILSASTKAGGDGVQTIGHINTQLFSCITSDISTDEVIITSERIAHSNLHDNAYEKYAEQIPIALASPDYIFADNHPNTGIVIKRLADMEGRSMQIVLRVKVSTDPKGYKNSVISCWDISESRLQTYLRNRKILYSSKKT